MICVYLMVILLGFYFLFYRKKKMGIHLPPGPKGFPIIGSALDINGNNIMDKFDKLVEKYGDIFCVQLLNDRLIIINSEPLARVMFLGEKYKRLTNDRSPFFVGEYILYGGQSIASISDSFGTVHSAMRKGMAKGLHVYGDEGLAHFETNILTELQTLNVNIEKSGNTPIDLMNMLRRSISNTISLALIGKSINDDDPDVNIFWDYVDGVNYFLEPANNILLMKFPALRFVPGFYKRVYDNMVTAKQKLLTKFFISQKDSVENGNSRGMVDVLLRDNQKDASAGSKPIFHDERISAMVLETVAAGILTTWSVLSSTFICLLHHPEYQDKAFTEIMEVIGPDRDATHSDKHNCPMLEAIEMEVHRLITVVPLLLPRNCKQDIEFEGFNIPTGSTLYLNIWHIHHDEKIWGDPWTFRPERFLDEQGQLLPRDHLYRRNWLPFGIGRRSCIGEPFARSRYFLYLATVLKKWKFVPCPARFGSCDPRNMEDFDNEVTIRPKPFFCTATHR